MGAPLVSVILPVHDGARFLAQTLESALAQDHRPLEVVVIDDGSTDDSARLAESHPGVQVFRQENRGVAAARNEGVRRARGRFLAFLDQDDLWEAGKLRLQLARLQERPDLGFVMAMQRPLLAPGDPVPAWVRPGLLSAGTRVYVPSNLLVRREVFEQVGPFDETLRGGGDDTDWFARARDASVAHEFLDEVLLHKRIHAGASSGRVAESKGDLLKLLRAKIRRGR